MSARFTSLRDPPHVEAFRLRGLPPQDRARAAWARLRKAGVDPRRPVAAWLAIEMLVRDDLQADQRNEFKRVQAAKLVHRMASGSHRRWGEEALMRPSCTSTRGPVDAS